VSLLQPSRGTYVGSDCAHCFVHTFASVPLFGLQASLVRGLRRLGRPHCRELSLLRLQHLSIRTCQLLLQNGSQSAVATMGTTCARQRSSACSWTGAGCWGRWRPGTGGSEEGGGCQFGGGGRLVVDLVLVRRARNFESRSRNTSDQTPLGFTRRRGEGGRTHTVVSGTRGGALADGRRGRERSHSRRGHRDGARDSRRWLWRRRELPKGKRCVRL
jgi:hypothetical protein